MGNEPAPAPETAKKKTGCFGIFLILLQLLAVVLCWLYGGLFVAMFSAYPKWNFACSGVICVAAYFLIKGAADDHRRTRICVTVMAAAFAGIVGSYLYRYLTVDRYAEVTDEISFYRYQPFSENSLVVKVTPDPKYRIDGKLPVIDCALALYPIGAGAVRALYPEMKYRESTERLLDANGSDTVYEKLLDRKVDLILALRPSRRQLNKAKNRGLTYEITPIGREAFVFFVHHRNPVDALTSEQIRKIYSGKITRWSEAGAAGNSSVIKPFQRNEGSGSQTMLQKIMGDTPIMPPLMEDRLGDMGGIINDVASYRNREEALGFSFRFFASEMFKNGKIKLLAIDGVAPTRENIRNSTYPFIAEFCVVTVGERSENTRKIVEFLLSPAGQELIDKVGYVPLN